VVHKSGLGGVGVSLLALLIVSEAHAQNAGMAPALAGLPVPVPPATVARDTAGHVTVRAVQIPEPIIVDGRLDEDVYTRVPPIDGFIQQEPHEGQPATEPTDVWVFFDEKNLYIAARCHDSDVAHLVANEMRRDAFAIFQNDNFGVLLDTFHDRRNGFLFYTNPLGGLVDSYVSDERDTNRDWNTVWDVRTGRFDGGWTVEIVLPFRSLRYPGPGPQVWGIQFRRVVRSKNEFSYLTPVPAAFTQRAISRVSTAATLVVDFEVGRWADIRPGGGSVLDFFVPHKVR
jgi:hypothetical protein